MPTRVMIHSSEVSTILSRSALVSNPGGTYVPRALILARIAFVNEYPLWISAHIVRDSHQECLMAGPV
jgi:hypothetical protein